MFAAQLLSCAFVLGATLTLTSYVLLRHCLIQWSDEL
jgi:hypothetical protein